MDDEVKGFSCWNRWITGWIELFQGIVKILTLGLLKVAWDLRYAKRVTKKGQRGKANG